MGKDFCKKILFKYNIYIYFSREHQRFSLTETRRQVIKNNSEENITNLFSKKITVALDLIAKYFYEKIKERERVVFILDYAETIVPASPTHASSEDDRF